MQMESTVNIACLMHDTRLCLKDVKMKMTLYMGPLLISYRFL